MLENVKQALVQYHQAMEKADTAKAKALADLNKQFEVKGRHGYYVPEKSKGTEAYSQQYNEILGKYEADVKTLRDVCKANAEDALATAKADIIKFAQKAPDDEILNSIKALETIGSKNITKEEVLMLMENSRNYWACKALMQIANKADISMAMVTLEDVDEIMRRVGREVDDFFTYYNPLSYKTVSMVKSERTMLDIADNALDDFMNGYFAKGADNPLLETISEMKKQSTDAKADAHEKKMGELEARVDDIEAGYLN